MEYRFGRHIIDTDRYQLSRDGEAVAVEPLVFDLLAYLAEHRDRVVTREELLDKLWKGKVVTDAALGARLKDARKAVQDSGARQDVIRTVHGRGYQFVAEVSDAVHNDPGASTKPGVEIGLEDQGPVRYCRSADGTSIAHAQIGEGYPMVFTGSWMTHLEKDWENPEWGPLWHLARQFRLIRYDQRGNGMSEWNDVDISFERMVEDLEAVIDTYDYEKVAIFGPSQAASVSAIYAARHPHRVSHLVLYGGYPRGRRRRGDPQSVAESEALVTLIRQSWGNENPAIRQAYTSFLMPDVTREEADWFTEFQRICGPAENIARFRETFDDIDIVDQLDKINVPTLVLHSTGDSVSPISEGKLLAARIPGASFVTFDSRNHMIFEKEPEFPRLIKCITDFVQS